jgi:hypothetical protein
MGQPSQIRAWVTCNNQEHSNLRNDECPLSFSAGVWNRLATTVAAECATVNGYQWSSTAWSHQQQGSGSTI